MNYIFFMAWTWFCLWFGSNVGKSVVENEVEKDLRKTYIDCKELVKFVEKESQCKNIQEN
jgi:hypothetical protein